MGVKMGRIRGGIVQNQMTTGNRSLNSDSAVAKSLQKMTSGGILGEERKRGQVICEGRDCNVSYSLINAGRTSCY
jgi:hypothetical protein